MQLVSYSATNLTLLRQTRTYNLPPSIIAKPLPVRDPQAKTSAAKKKQKQKQQNDTKNRESTTSSHGQRNNASEDDAPKAFRRLMQFQTKGSAGLKTDDNNNKNKKRKRDAASKNDNSNKKPTHTEQQQQVEVPKILPGEKLSDFSARVDHALPLSGMTKSRKPASGLSKTREDRQTKHEKRLRRLQRGWREEEARIREKEEVEMEEREDEIEDQLRLWKEWEVEAGKAKKKASSTKKKTKSMNRTAGDRDGDAQNSDDDDDYDPWAKLNKRDQAQKANPFDVVQAPPQLTKPREIFKVRGGAKVDVDNVPVAVGSLRRREELAGERRSIVEEYRRLMTAKRQ